MQVYIHAKSYSTVCVFSSRIYFASGEETVSSKVLGATGAVHEEHALEYKPLEEGALCL